MAPTFPPESIPSRLHITAEFGSSGSRMRHSNRFHAIGYTPLPPSAGDDDDVTDAVRSRDDGRGAPMRRRRVMQELTEPRECLSFRQILIHQSPNFAKPPCDKPPCHKPPCNKPPCDKPSRDKLSRKELPQPSFM